MGLCESAVVRERSKPRVKRCYCGASQITIETIHKSDFTDTDDIIPSRRDHRIGKRIHAHAAARQYVLRNDRFLDGRIRVVAARDAATTGRRIQSDRGVCDVE